MALVTFIGSNNAKEGYEFIYTGPTPECKACRIKNACMSLEPGQRYRVKGVRDITHDCRLHDRVVVVEVERVPLQGAIDARSANAGTIVTIERRPCRNIGCENHPLCTPPFFVPGRYRVLDVGDGLRCVRGLDLRAARIEKA